MVNILRSYLIFFFLFIINGCTFLNKKNNEGGFNNVEKLKNELNTVINDPEFFNANWGVAVQSLKTGEYIYLKNENKNFIPASNMKLFTTAVALIKLSPTFRFCTSVYQNGEISTEGILEGDLIIKGSGDPTISGRFYNGNITYVFETWADSLKKYGIKAVNGNIIGDDNYFEDEIMGESWILDYQSDWYAAPISALSFNNNCMEIILAPGDSIGTPAKLKLEPETNYIEIINNLITVEEGLKEKIEYHRKTGTNQLIINGTIAINSKKKHNRFSIEDPTLYTTTIFKQVLEKNGIIVSGVARDIDDCPDYIYLPDEKYRLLRHFSPPLWEIVEIINKESHNLYAELILRTLGAKFKNEGNARKSIEVVEEELVSMGINPHEFNMYDGSGLSRLNLVTPKQIITLLRYLRHHPINKFFFNSLSIAGVDGSLKHRMKHISAKRRVKAKTGYLGNVVALSGYLITRDNEDLVFSIIANNYIVPVQVAQSIQDLICERLTNFSRYQMR